MPGLPPKLVVTTYAPKRRVVTIVVLLLLVAGSVYGMFELGRYNAGHDAFAALKETNGPARRNRSQGSHHFGTARQGGAAGIFHRRTDPGA